MKSNVNLLLNKIVFDGSDFSFTEVIPEKLNSSDKQVLVKYNDTDFYWMNMESSINYLENNRFINTNMYYHNGRIGINRFPLHNYIIDVAVPSNSLQTAFHIGDGSYGFSLGNGTSVGFIPEIIGIGGNENDAGLYFVGIAGNDISSNTPLIVFDSRDVYGQKIHNRPILGITSGNYDKYYIIIDNNGNINIDGEINVNSIKIKGKSLIDILNNLQKQIDRLTT